jgi:hypothetical protein
LSHKLVPRLTSILLVSALLRSVQAEGGFATVLHRGDADAGAVLVEWRDRSVAHGLTERTTDFNGNDGWRRVVLRDGTSTTDYVDRRRRSDPDLWVVELDIAQPERFIAIFTAAT